MSLKEQFNVDNKYVFFLRTVIYKEDYLSSHPKNEAAKDENIQTRRCAA